MVVSDQEILFFMGIYPTAFALNLLYPQATPPPAASYWFNAGFEHLNFDAFTSGSTVTFEKYGVKFSASVENVIAITFEPGSDQCLWVLRPELANADGLSATASEWLGVSNAARILSSPAVAPPYAIFGREPERIWCYYFERADLARQNANWAEVMSLWAQAAEEGLRAPNGVELLPFIEAHARQGSWEDALTLTRQAQVLPDRSTSLLCDLWRDLGTTAPPSPGRDDAVARILADLACQP
jgi:hypothetical protein